MVAPKGWATKPSGQAVSLAGEFYVLAQLALSDLVATMTLGKAKGVDILVSNPRTGRLFQVEVKSKTKLPTRSRVFGHNHEWLMDEKHERLRDPTLVYCFVHLEGALSRPRFWLASSIEVADYVRDEHQTWLAKGGRQQTVHTVRIFRIPSETRHAWEENWGIFDAPPKPT